MSAAAGLSHGGQVVPDGCTTKKINNLLNSSQTRFEGLLLLNLFLPKCPDGDFINFCVSWMQNCCKTDGLAKNRNYSILLLRDLLKTSSNYAELKKSVSFFITTRYFDFFFKHLLQSEAGWSCTETCLRLYRGACGPFQEGLKKHLTSEISRKIRISVMVARCFALLPSAGGGGNDGINYKQNWKNQFTKFLNVCHSILNDLFSDVENFQFQECEAIESMNNTQGGNKDAKHGAIHFQNCCSILNFMLLNQYPTSKSIPCDSIFQLTCRGLALNPTALRKHETTESISLRKILPDIHCALLRLLKATIVTCKNQLLPYAHLICKLMKQCLQWTEYENGYENGKPLSRLRISMYETLCDWMVAARSGSCVETISDIIISNAVSDIRSRKETVLLKEAKTQKQFRNSEQATRPVDVTANGTLCQAALTVLQLLLKYTGVLLKAESHKFLQEVVVKLLLEIQKASASDVAPPPFSVAQCRTGLYCLLLELVQQPCPNWPPPTHLAFRLFAKGLNDASPQVSSFCSGAINCTTIIIHPQYDNGGFPLRGASDDGAEAREAERKEELMEVVEERGLDVPEEKRENEENGAEGETSKIAIDSDERSEISSDEDSVNTIAFSKEESEIRADGVRREDSPRRSPKKEGESSPSLGTSSAEKISLRKTGSPAVESVAGEGRSKVGETPEKDSEDPKSISPESSNEEGHARGRYFLRSKTKGSSEEPEETLKRTCSPESSGRGTPAKTPARMTPSVQNSKKRPRTRALSKAEGTGETPRKNRHDDEEDIKAAFDDSFLD